MKKFLTTIFILVILLGGILGPFGVKTAEAFLPALIAAGPAIWTGFKIAAGLFAAAGLTGQLPIAAQTVAWFVEMVSQISSSILTFAGTLLDKAINFSFKTNLNDISAINIGWGVSRDVANIFFIFILLTIAIATILQIEKYGAKQLLAKVIIIAFFINFSLVITKIVIDASNIIAIPFYNTITNNGTGSLSATLASGLNLQQMFAAEEKEKLSAENAIKVFFLVTIFYLITAWIFFNIAFLFIARLVIFIFLMTIAPIAFLAAVLPGTSQYFQQWLDTLLKQALVAPIFLFFIYLTVLIIQGKNFLTIMTVENELEAVGLFNFVVVIGLMWASYKFTKNLSGSIGETAISLGKQATGLLTGAVAGGSAYTGRKTLGNLAKMAEQKLQGGQPTSAAGKFARDVGIKTFGGLGKASYDVRSAKIPGTNIPTLGEVATKHGISVGKGVSAKEMEVAAKEKSKAQKEQAVKLLVDNVETAVKSGNIAAIQQRMANLKPSQARELSRQARMDPTVIQNLSTRHLQDLMNNGDLTTPQRDQIVNVITGPTSYSNQNTQMGYINSSAAKHLWI